LERFEMPILPEDLVYLTVFGFATGTGSTFGAELVKFLLAHAKKKMGKKERLP
jgi:hypothetical protein